MIEEYEKKQSPKKTKASAEIHQTRDNICNYRVCTQGKWVSPLLVSDISRRSAQKASQDNYVTKFTMQRFAVVQMLRALGAGPRLRQYVCIACIYTNYIEDK